MDRAAVVGYDDAVLLADDSDVKSFTANLKKRFNQNIIYTYIGNVLVFVNPYKNLDVYSSTLLKTYEEKQFFEVHPHVFAIVDNAFRSLQNEKKGQCILISGESGSGKTENSKHVLYYISEVTEQKGNAVKDKLVKANPVLEAFGNAKTTHNDNSSRFGKYMEVLFNDDVIPSGGILRHYLLEKSRVISQASGERNFHVYYQVLRGASDQELERLKLTRTLESYAYLSNQDECDKGIDDEKAFQEIQNALQVLEFEQQEQNEIFEVIAAILHLGNVKISAKQTSSTNVISEIENEELIDTISKLLGCSTENLKSALTSRTIKPMGEIINTPLDKTSASYTRDALTKVLHERLFSWLIERINISLRTTDAKRCMGILDIYGFEILKQNSFEQLCINFCNEKLHQFITEVTIKYVQEDYFKEGLTDQPAVNYVDNSVICELFERKHQGLLTYLDEYHGSRKKSDKEMLSTLDDKLSYHEHYISHEKADRKLQKTMGRDEFLIKHYAGDVKYKIEGFMEKNTDFRFRDLKETLSKSSNQIVKSFFSIHELNSNSCPKSVIAQFKTSVDNLMKILKNKQSSCIRCIRPNTEKKPGVFEEDYVAKQVTHMGLMENVKVRRGYAYYYEHKAFLKKYKYLSTETWPHYRGEAKNGVQLLMNSLGFPPGDYAMGKTRIFIKHTTTMLALEQALLSKQHDSAIVIQAIWKGVIQRKKFKLQKENNIKEKKCIIIQAAWKGLCQKRKYRSIIKAAIIVQKYIKEFIARRRMEEQHNAANVIKRVMKRLVRIRLERRTKAANVIRNFVKGFLTRNGPETPENKIFLKLAVVQWLIRLSKNLPQKLVDCTWPPCPLAFNEASKYLERLYGAHLSRIYRLNLSPERTAQLRLKALADDKFKGEKVNYEKSIPIWFQSRRTENIDAAQLNNFLFAHGEEAYYTSTVTKYDRHGQKPRERVMAVTTENLYLLEVTKSIKAKHILSLSKLEFEVTTGDDKMLLVKIPADLMKKDKGDIILGVPHLIEGVAHILLAADNTDSLTITNAPSVEYSFMKGICPPSDCCKTPAKSTFNPSRTDNK